MNTTTAGRKPGRGSFHRLLKSGCLRHASCPRNTISIYIYSIARYDINTNSVRKEARDHTKQPEEKQRKGEQRVAGHGEKTMQRIFIVPGTSYKNDQPIDRRRYRLRLALIGRARRPNHHLHPPARIHGMYQMHCLETNLPTAVPSTAATSLPRTFFVLENARNVKNNWIVRPPHGWLHFD